MNFIQQAYKGKTNWWLFILVVIIAFLGQFIGALSFRLVAVLKSPNTNAFKRVLNDITQGKNINANLFLFLMLFSIAIGLLFLFIAIKYLHKRKIITVLTSRKKIDWKRFFFAFILWFSLALVMIALDYFSAPEDFVWNFKLLPFVLLVLIAFILLPLQTSFEEVLFRGYLMQGIGILFRYAWVPLLITSLMFGLLHGFNPEVDKLGPMVYVYYIGTGLFFAIATLMDDGLELALGMHAANNIVAAIFVTTNWTVFQTDALLIDVSEPSLGMQAYLPVFIIYPIILFVYSKKYKWTNWNEKLFGRIKKPFPKEINEIGETIEEFL